VESGKYRLAKRLRIAGRIIALVAVVFGGMMLIGEAVGEIQQNGWSAITGASITDPGVLLVIIGVIALAGCILSWLRERAAGILLVLTSAALGAHIGFFAGQHHLLAWTMVGLPYLAAGVLLLVSWRVERKDLGVGDMEDKNG